METLLIVLIFSVILFLYLHIYFHLKINNDVDLYVLEMPSKEKLEEVCDLRQPIIFNYNNTYFDKCNLNFFINDAHGYDLKIRNLNHINTKDDCLLPLTLESSIKLFNTDNLSSFYTENNHEFIEDTGIIDKFRSNDTYLRPYLVSNTSYDILSGSKGTVTPLRYNLNYRNYYLVTQGEVHVKLAPPKYKKYLHVENDYSMFEFRSKVNVWNESISKEYKHDLNKVKFIDTVLKKGQIIYIPAYWWYSFKFTPSSTVLAFYYKTYMNNLTILPHYILKILQSQNTKHSLSGENLYINSSLLQTENLTNIAQIDTVATDAIDATDVTNKPLDKEADKKSKKKKNNTEEPVKKLTAASIVTQLT